MKHGFAGRKLGRPSDHRVQMLRNLVTQLIENERITTTVGRAKETSKLAESIIALGRQGSFSAWQHANEQLRGQERLLGRLFTVIAERYALRKGGYTRVLHSDTRQGDGAPTAVLELVESEASVKYDTTARAVARQLAFKALSEDDPNYWWAFRSHIEEPFSKLPAFCSQPAKETSPSPERLKGFVSWIAGSGRAAAVSSATEGASALTKVRQRLSDAALAAAPALHSTSTGRLVRPQLNVPAGELANQSHAPVNVIRSRGDHAEEMYIPAGLNRHEEAVSRLLKWPDIDADVRYKIAQTLQYARTLPLVESLPVIPGTSIQIPRDWSQVCLYWKSRYEQYASGIAHDNEHLTVGAFLDRVHHYYLRSIAALNQDAVNTARAKLGLKAPRPSDLHLIRPSKPIYWPNKTV